LQEGIALPDFRVIPSIEQLRQRPAILDLVARFGADAVVDAVRAAAAAMRERIAAGDAGLTAQPAVVEHIEADAAMRLEARSALR
jgi:Selenocysteine synthase N terminal.